MGIFEKLEPPECLQPVKPSKALVVVYHGKAMCLCCGPLVEGEYAAIDVLTEEDSSREMGFPLDAASVDCPRLPDGVYCGEMRVENDGLGDWPGSVEICVAFRNWRQATEEEWCKHLWGEWPW
jgi:hypothetical protein